VDAVGADGPVRYLKLAGDQPGQVVDQRGSDAANQVQLDLEALDAEIGRFLAAVPVVDGVAAKLNRLLCGFLEAEVLPVADRAATMGVDPGPLLGVVSDLLRRYADALERPDAATP
jgi:hypothetical protein